MAEWTGKKVDKSQINNGKEYELIDAVTIEELNSMVNNSLYASQIAESYISEAENIVTQGKTDITSQTTQGKAEITTLTENNKTQLNSIVDEAENLVDEANSSINTVVGTANEALFKVEQVLKNEGYWGSNPNLLINGDFRVNQSKLTTYTVNGGFTVDGWKLSYGSLTVNSDGSVTHTAANTWQGIIQYITKPSKFAGKTVTLSVYASATTNKLAQMSLLKAGSSKATTLGSTDAQTGTGITGFTATIPSDITDDDKLYVLLYTPQANQSVTYYWTKLEIGSVATAYSPKPYEEELADCQCIEGGVATTYSNPNLLINGDFSVNQRNFDGKNIEILKSVYCFDRWRYYHWGNSAEITKNNDGSISIYNTTTDTSQGTGILYFTQQVERFASRTCNNETYTISLKYKLEYPDSSKQGDCYFYFEQAGATTSGTLTGKLNKTTTPVIDTRTFTVDGTTTKGSVAVNLRQGAKLTIYWVKLETGSIATAFSSRTYAEELALCQRYYQVINNIRLTGFVGSVGYASTTVTYLTQMRAEPTIAILNPVTIRYGGVSYTQTNATTNAWWKTTNEIVISLSNFSNNPVTSYWNSITKTNVFELDAEY